MFKEINVAYDVLALCMYNSQVLSDPRRRGIYDKYGEEGLYGDVPPQDDDFFDDED